MQNDVLFSVWWGEGEEETQRSVAYVGGWVGNKAIVEKGKRLVTG